MSMTRRRDLLATGAAALGGAVVAGGLGGGPAAAASTDATPNQQAKAAGQPAPAGNQVRPGDFFVEPPTLTCLGFEWRIDGDDNRNATCSVQYRKRGAQTWTKGLDLVRLNGERVYSNVRFDVVNPNMFCGSVFDLEPDTEYEVRFTITDPDGVLGNGRKDVVVRTRPEPVPFAGGRTFHCYPDGTPDSVKIQPAFEGFNDTYNNSGSGTDMAWATRPRVRPGDTILVHAGLYKYSREFYTNTASLDRTHFEGTYYLRGKGTADKPIAIKAAGDGEVIFDGNGCFNLFNLKVADYHYFEGITFRNCEIALWAGSQHESGCVGLTVKKCRFEDIGFGIWTNYSGSKNFYIADNALFGRNDPDHVIIWSDPSDTDYLGQPFPPSMGQPSLDTTPPRYGSYMAIKVYGPGHVICFNEVHNFHDGIDCETYGNPDGSFATDPNLPDTTNGPKYPPKEFWDLRPVSIDVYNNLMDNFHDNPFEADGSLHNYRIMRNLILNSASHGFCNQPTLGGPIYWIRNIAYHMPRGSTRGEATGAHFFNNTILSETAPTGVGSNMQWRNNLILGEGFTDRIFDVSTHTNYTSSDYNGFRVNPGVANSFRWNSPPFDVASDQPTPTYTPTLVTRDFATLADYSAATGQDQHSVLVDYDIFVNVPKLDAQDPAQRTTRVDVTNVDFRLKPGSAAVDAGTVIPNVTDGFTGAAPDLGALESGKPLIQYGPRLNGQPHWK
jgi:hypothetical protein